MRPESLSTSSRQRAAEAALHRYWTEFEAQAREIGMPMARLAGELPIDGSMIEFVFQAGRPASITWRPIELEPAP